MLEIVQDSLTSRGGMKKEVRRQIISLLVFGVGNKSRSSGRWCCHTVTAWTSHNFVVRLFSLGFICHCPSTCKMSMIFGQCSHGRRVGTAKKGGRKAFIWPSTAWRSSSLSQSAQKQKRKATTSGLQTSLKTVRIWFSTAEIFKLSILQLSEPLRCK